jgi:chemotaxis signal transduction protein
VNSKFREQYSQAIEKSKGDEKYALIYRIGDALLLIPLNEVIDILESVQTSKVPGSVEFFDGFFSYKGKPVILLNTPLVLSLSGEGADTVMIVRLLGGDMFGIKITSVVQVIPYNDSWEQHSTSEMDIIHPVFVEDAVKINQNIIYQIKLNRLFSKNSQ